MYPRIHFSSTITLRTGWQVNASPYRVHRKVSGTMLHNLLHQPEHPVGHVAEGEINPGACGHYRSAV